MSSAGPSVISRNSSEGGYFVARRNDSTVKIPDGCARPRRRIAVDVQRAQHEEACNQERAPFEELAPANLRRQQEDRAARETERHDGKPRNQRVGREHRNAAEEEHAGLMQDVPDTGQPAEACRRHAIERVVQKDDGDAAGKHDPPRQMNERREHDHRQPERPQDEEQERIRRQQREVHRHPHDDELDDDQRQAARAQKPGQLPARRPRTLQAQECAGAGAAHEHRRADVRDPAGEEDDRRRAREVFGRKAHRAGVDEVARVIQRHDHHDQPAQRVERRQARVRCRGAHRRAARGSPSHFRARVINSFCAGLEKVDDSCLFVLFS